MVEDEVITLNLLLLTSFRIRKGCCNPSFDTHIYWYSHSVNPTHKIFVRPTDTEIDSFGCRYSISIATKLTFRSTLTFTSSKAYPSQGFSYIFNGMKSNSPSGIKIVPFEISG